MRLKKKPIGLQLYTLRGETAKDFPGTLNRVAEMGYNGVELAGTGGLSAHEMCKVLTDAGLKVYGSHVGLEQLEKDLTGTIAYHKEIGCKYLVCPSLAEDRRQNGQAYRQIGGTLETVGRACREAGLGFCYHNHAFEFQSYDGVHGLDLLYKASDPGLVQAELDLYWVAYAGLDPAAYLTKLKGRVPLLHLKDMAADRAFAEVGEGILDWPAVFEAAEAAGVVYYLVEQDECKRPPLEAVGISLQNLRRMGIA